MEKALRSRSQRQSISNLAADAAQLRRKNRQLEVRVKCYEVSLFSLSCVCCV